MRLINQEVEKIPFNMDYKKSIEKEKNWSGRIFQVTYMICKRMKFFKLETKTIKKLK